MILVQEKFNLTKLGTYVLILTKHTFFFIEYIDGQMKKLIEILSFFDWISPTAAILEDVFEGGVLNLDVWTFFIPFDEAASRGWSPFHIGHLLARHGIRSWGNLLRGNEFSFKVKLAQAQWAEYVLTRYGVPVHQNSLSAPLPKRKTRQSTKRKEKAEYDDPLTRIDNFLEKYL